MNGNVRERCWDWRGAYSVKTGEVTEDPTGPATGTLRMNRGGSFGWNTVVICSPWNRQWGAPPDAHQNVTGFRIARTLLPFGRSEIKELNRKGVDLEKPLQNEAGGTDDMPTSTINRAAEAPKDTPPVLTAGGFASLFNGKDLQGWTNGLANGSEWNVDDGVLEGRGVGQTSGPAVLYTDRSNFGDFRIRLQAQNTDNSTCLLVVRRPETENSSDKISGYAIAIGGTSNGRGGEVTIGSIAKCVEFAPGGVPTFDGWALQSTVAAEEWHTVEVAVTENTVFTTVDGKKVARYADPENTFPRGTIALACRLTSAVRVKNVEIMQIGNVPKTSNDRSPEDKPRPTLSERLLPGTVWTGNRTYHISDYNGATVSYYLHIRERNGPLFSAHAFNNGPNRNVVQVEGRISGNTVSWQEKRSNNDPIEYLSEGVFSGDMIRFKFQRPSGQQSDNQGNGVLLIRK